MCHANNCQKPDQLKGKPADCTPEQIKACHGDEANHPCTQPPACEAPPEHKGTARSCSPEQIKKCHGQQDS